MSVYKKLQEARVKLQSVKMSKSGSNKFAGYKYFELGDFLPHINTIFNEVGLCGAISFNADQATLRVFSVDGDGQIEFTSPTAEAPLKGCTPIQCLGSQQTYLRRYLWMAALEIVEHDALDAVTGNDAVEEKPKQQKQAQQKQAQQKLTQNEHQVADWISALEGTSVLPELAATWQTVPPELKEIKSVKDTYASKYRTFVPKKQEAA